jgi:ribosomal protein L19
MKIKSSLLAAFCLYVTSAAFAQTSDAEADAMINLFGVQKKEAVAKLVSVSGKDSVTFWKIYDEYQKENKANAKDRIKLYEGTALAYSNMTPAIADSLANQYFSNRMGMEKTLETYYKKIKTAVNPIAAFEFYQAETFLLTQVRASIMRQVPTYGELQALKKN